jgi:hypothetical protein
MKTTTKKKTAPEGSADTSSFEPVTLATMNDFATITGSSGKVYRASNLLTEMNTRQKNACRDAVRPVLPIIIMLAAEMKRLAVDAAAQLKDQEAADSLDALNSVSNAELVELFGKIDLSAVFNALLMEDLDLRLLACLYLPEDMRTFHPESVDERMKDLEDITYYEKFQAFRRFFSSNFSFSPGSSRGFIQSMMTTN